MAREVTRRHWDRGLRFEVPETGMLRGVIRWPDSNPPDPFGCRRCGFRKKYHRSFYVPHWGYHEWEQPTTVQVKARMRARRRATLDERAKRQSLREQLVQKYTVRDDVSYPTGPDDVES